VSNPFKILIVAAIVVALVLAAGFVYTVFFKDPGKVSRSISGSSLIESV
jgi:hypothetical protein